MSKRKVLLLLWIGLLAAATNDAFAEANFPYEKVEIREKELVANFYFDKTQKTPTLPVIILGGSEGGLPRDKYLVENLTQHGFSVMQVAYFKAGELSQTLTSIPLEFFDKAYNWLQKSEHAVKGKVAIIGTSKGGELALLLGSRHKCVATVVALVPSGYVFQGIPGKKYHNGSSWSYKGQDLPFLPYQGGIMIFIKAMKKDYYGMYEDALKEKSQYPEARIKVENIEAPILLISAENDQMWPSKAMCDEIAATLKEKEFSYEYVHRCFKTGHGVFENKDARQLVIDFIRKYYKDKTENEKQRTGNL